MAHPSPPKRSALGSISSILNTTYKSPGKHGRIGKSATPRSLGIRHKIATLLGVNKENSPRKLLFGDWVGREGSKVQRRGGDVYDDLSADHGPASSGKVAEAEKLSVASNIDVLASSNIGQQRARQPPPKISPEVRQMATVLSARLRLAAYKVTTQQIHAPFSELALLPTDSQDSVSQAIQRFRESKRLQEKTEFYRNHRLDTTCRRESWRARHAKSTSSLRPSTFTTHHSSLDTRVPHLPSTIIEVPSDQEGPGLPSPPDSLQSIAVNKVPRTPAPKRKIRKMKKTKRYNEFNGHLGLSSPPQEAYDRQEEQEWVMEDVEVGDVPSSVLRGVEGLWALAK